MRVLQLNLGNSSTLKKYFSLLLLLLMTVAVQAQFDNTNHAINIPAAPPSKPKTPNPPPTAAIPAPKALSPSIFDDAFKQNRTLTMPDNTNAGFGKDEKFANPSRTIENRMNRSAPSKENSYVERKNFYLGEVTTDAGTVNVVYRDHEYPDGDVIRVYVNGKVVKESVLLESEFKGFYLALEPGFNQIDFEAVNQGTSGPNTAEFIVYDDYKKVISSNRWNLATGFKATIIVVKE